MLGCSNLVFNWVLCYAVLVVLCWDGLGCAVLCRVGLCCCVGWVVLCWVMSGCAGLRWLSCAVLGWVVLSFPTPVLLFVKVERCAVFLCVF